MPKRYSDEERQVMVGWALLHLSRPDLLEDSELVAVLNIQADGFLGRGKELRARLLESAGRVAEGLADAPGMGHHKSLLDAVLAGETVAGWARANGKSRESVSRRTWRDVTYFVTQELERLAVLSTTAHRDR